MAGNHAYHFDTDASVGGFSHVQPPDTILIIHQHPTYNDGFSSAGISTTSPCRLTLAMVVDPSAIN